MNEMGYQPNRLGRALVMSSRTTKLGVITQFSETPFMKMVLEGTKRAKEELQAIGTEVLIACIPSYNEDSTLNAIDQMAHDGIQGLALTPGNSPAIRQKMQQVIASGIPIITLNSDAPGTKRLAYVGLDNYRAGQTAAGLMSITLRGGGTILPISGYMENTSHSHRMKGFYDVAQSEFRNLRLLELKQCHDSDDVAEQIVLQSLREHPDLSGIYLAGNGQVGVCRALRKFGKAGKVCVLCYDLTEDNVTELRKGALDFILDQNAEEQGYRPLMLLYEKLVMGQNPPSEYLYTDICIKTRFNL